jgi:hypothetical protein
MKLKKDLVIKKGTQFTAEPKGEKRKFNSDYYRISIPLGKDDSLECYFFEEGLDYLKSKRIIK